jgi:hypothetical protein
MTGAAAGFGPPSILRCCHFADISDRAQQTTGRPRLWRGPHVEWIVDWFMLPADTGVASVAMSDQAGTAVTTMLSA